MKLLVGISGSIAAYKTLDVVSNLVKQGWEIKTVLTQNAKTFITPLSLHTITDNPVYEDDFNESDFIPHISLRNFAEALLICPASYNVIGKIANGIADDLLTTIASCFEGPKILAPAMNVNMWANPILKINLDRLLSFGWEMIHPSQGILACGDVGYGKLADVSDITTYMINLSDRHKNSTIASQPLSKKKVLITGGGTVERIDDARVISNLSSGKMSVALVKEALKLGADVTYLKARSEVQAPSHPKLRIIQAESFQAMEKALSDRFPSCDILLMAAAISDFTVSHPFEYKIRRDNEKLLLELSRTPDLLLSLSEMKTKQFIVGFSALSNNLESESRVKLEKKGLDLMFANRIGGETSAFGSDHTECHIIAKDTSESLGYISKESASEKLFQKIISMLP